MAADDKIIDAIEKMRESQDEGLKALHLLRDELRAKDARIHSRMDGYDVQLRGDGQNVRGVIPRVDELEKADKRHDDRFMKLEEGHSNLIWRGIAALGTLIVLLASALGAVVLVLLGGGSNHK